MNKIKMCILLIIIIFSVVGCSAHYYERPQFKSSEKWVSDNPDIYFVSLMSIEQNNDGLFVGKLNTEYEQKDIGVVFDNDNQRHGIYFYPIKALQYDKKDTDDRLFCGSYELSDDKLIVAIENDRQNLFNDEVKTIIFKKEIIEPNSDPYIESWAKIRNKKINEVYDEFVKQIQVNN